MRKLLQTAALAACLHVPAALAQQYLPLSDDLDIQSGSDIKIAAGNYSLTDSGNDGLIRLVNVTNVILDGDSVEADGMTMNGYAVRIDGCDSILIRNFTLVRGFRYAVYITNSSNIEVEHCNFSFNRVDSTGVIDVWAGCNASLGGGVCCCQGSNIRIHDNVMKFQNDGVALYQCLQAEVSFNDFAWNTSFGVRMFFTDSSFIHHNKCSHVNRPYTDPSDCAALLMIVSNANRVEFNDLSFSGDGVFLGQYQHSSVPNNNFFGWNDCSGSPHNAIEATFADGNVFKYNNCSMSHYGFWLGYSFNSLLDSNVVMYNNHSGIAIDRGFNNTITNNWIIANPTGIALWEGSPLPGYQNQASHHYFIDSCLFEGNTTAVSAKSTDNTVIRANQFVKNQEGIFLEGPSVQNLLSGNLFDQSLLFDINNQSAQDIAAAGNYFTFNDTIYINKKIFDKQDDPAMGLVMYQPFTGLFQPMYVMVPPSELSEEPSLWTTYPEECWWMGNPGPLSLTWDTLDKISGDASLRLQTGTGWYNTCTYRDTGNRVPRWDLSDYGYLSFWIKSLNANLGAFQYFHVRIGNLEGGYFRYDAGGSLLNQSLGQWKHYIMPLYGGAGWALTQAGDPDLSDINYVEFYTDSYGVGYDLWLDGVSFLLATGVPDDQPGSPAVSLFPNPATGESLMITTLAEPSFVRAELFDVHGRIVRSLLADTLASGTTQTRIDLGGISPGLYILLVQFGNDSFIKKLCIPD